MRTCVRGTRALIRRAHRGEDGFTLLEIMIAIVLMTIGLLAVADVFPHAMALSLYGKDQTRGTYLAQQQMEVYRNTPTSTLATSVGDYGTVASGYFDQNGGSATQSAAYFTRDVQIQYWTWSTSLNAFVQPASPYVLPSGSYVYHVAVTTHWKVRGQTAYTSGTPSTNGCVSGSSVATTGLGCVTVTTFATP